MDSIKNKFTSVFVKKFLIPNAQIFNKPAFVVFKISGKSNIYTRQVIFPEEIAVNFQKEIIAKFGIDAKKKLYSVGKKWGFRFAELQNFTKKSDAKDKAGFLSFVSIMNDFIEGTYAKKMKYDFDFEKNLAKFELEDFVFLNKLTFDYFFALGGAAGLWCYLLERNDIEGVQSKFEKGISYCEYSVPDNLDKSKEIFIETNLSNLAPEREYKDLNNISETKFSKKSFSDYLTTKVFTYENGKILRKNLRFFLFESTGFYLLETVAVNDEFKEILYNSSLNSGINLLKTFEKPNVSLVADLLSALGWGDPYIIEKQGKINLIIEHVPWTKFYDKIDFIILNGFISGMLTEVLKRKIFLNSPKKTLSSQLTLTFIEK